MRSSALLILVVGWWVSNRVARVFASIGASVGSAWAVRVIALVAALSEVGIATASVLAALGAAGLAIGLALQGTLQNIAAGIMLLMLRPFRAGDVIEGSGAAAGVVCEVGLFTTRIERGDGNVVFVPNIQIWSNPVINHSSGGTQRIDVTVDLARRDQVDAAIGKLKEMVSAEPRVQGGTTLAPTVAVDNYPSGGGARLRVRAWVRNADAQYAVDDIRGHAREALATAGLAVMGNARVAGADAALTQR